MIETRETTETSVRDQAFCFCHSVHDTEKNTHTQQIHTYCNVDRYRGVDAYHTRALDVGDSLLFSRMFTVESRLVARQHDNFIFRI